MQNNVSPELRRNTKEKVVFGVAAGLADYFGIDTAIMRVAFIVTAILSFGFMLIVYLLLAIFIPEREHSSNSSGTTTNYRTSSDPKLVNQRRIAAGWVVLILGVVLLFENFGLFKWLNFGKFWPVLLIALGLALVLGIFRGTNKDG